MPSLKWQSLQKSSLQSPCADPRGSSSVPPAVPSPSSHVWRTGTKANGFPAGLIVSPCCTAPPYQAADQHFVTAVPSGLACSTGCESPLKDQLLSRLLFRARIALGRLMGLGQDVSAAVLAEHFLQWVRSPLHPPYKGGRTHRAGFTMPQSQISKCLNVLLETSGWYELAPLQNFAHHVQHP